MYVGLDAQKWPEVTEPATSFWLTLVKLMLPVSVPAWPSLNRMFAWLVCGNVKRAMPERFVVVSSVWMPLSNFTE